MLTNNDSIAVGNANVLIETQVKLVRTAVREKITPLTANYAYGMLVVNSIAPADNLNVTNNNVKVGYCDSNGDFQEVADNITF